MPLFLRNGLVFFSLVCFYAASYNALLDHKSGRAMGKQGAAGWDLPPLLLKVLAVEFKGLVADLIVLDIGAQLGTAVVRDPKGGYKTVVKQYDWDSIGRSFVASQSLDPSFQQTYIIAQGWLPWKPAGMLAETQEILKTAAMNRPWDWQPYHSLGFNNYYFMNRPGEAGKFFLEAAKVPNAPPFLTILGARLAQKGGETEAAIVMMKSMLAKKDADEPGYVDMLDRLHALEGVFILEQAVQKYTQIFGNKPGTLDELTQNRVLEKLPENPYNLTYCIDNNGTIFFDNPYCLTPRPTP